MAPDIATVHFQAALGAGMIGGAAAQTAPPEFVDEGGPEEGGQHTGCASLITAVLLVQCCPVTHLVRVPRRAGEAFILK